MEDWTSQFTSHPHHRLSGWLLKEQFYQLPLLSKHELTKKHMAYHVCLWIYDTRGPFENAVRSTCVFKGHHAALQ